MQGSSSVVILKGKELIILPSLHFIGDMMPRTCSELRNDQHLDSLHHLSTVGL